MNMPILISWCSNIFSLSMHCWDLNVDRDLSKVRVVSKLNGHFSYLIKTFDQNSENDMREKWIPASLVDF